MTLLSDDQLKQFIESGYLVVPDVIAAGDVQALNAEVDRLVAEAPPAMSHVGNHFYWQGPADSPALFDVLERPRGILELARDLIGNRGVELAFDQAQVALNIPPFDHRPDRPHIDGYQPGQTVPGTFTLLASLLLNDQSSDNGGNLWVWPGTHRSHADFFARRGPRGFAEAAGYPDVELPQPTQVRGPPATFSSRTTCSDTTSAGTTRATGHAARSTGGSELLIIWSGGLSASLTRGPSTRGSGVCSPLRASRSRSALLPGMQSFWFPG